jgi:hypothetical protein
MKRIILIGLAIVVLLTPVRVRAEGPRDNGHLVSLSTIQARLGQAFGQRQADLAEVVSVRQFPS